MESNEYCIDGKPITDLKVVELRKELEKRSLSKSGNKKELYERLRDYLQNNPDDYSIQSENMSNDEVASSPLVAQYLVNQKEALEAARRDALDRSDVVNESHISQFDSSNFSDELELASTEITDSSKRLPTDVQVLTDSEQVDISGVEEQPSENTENLTQNEHVYSYIGIESKPNASEIFYDTISAPETSESLVLSLPATEFVVPSNIEYFDNGNGTENDEISQEQHFTSENTSKDEHFESIVPDEVVEDDSCDNFGPSIEKSEKVFADDELDYDQEEDVESDHGSSVKRQKLHSPCGTPETVPMHEEEAILVTNEKVNKGETITHQETSISHSSEITSDGFNRVKAASPPRHPVSRWIHIRGLKRPFTQKSLLTMLSSYGNVLDEELWLDSIKSNCIVAYSDDNEALIARERLHNCVWPQSSDSFLTVDFSSEDKFLRRKAEDTRLTGNERLLVVVESQPKEEQITVTVKNDTSSKKRKADDYIKPQKTLEELFKKTKTQPSIYFLPLTDEQVAKRSKERRGYSQRNYRLHHTSYNNGRRK